MLENMFHATLYALLQTTNHKYEVQAVSPQNVRYHWIATPKLNPRTLKMAKVDVARTILNDEHEDIKVETTGEAKEVAEHLLTGKRLGKVDDLADSMLQALAWWHWDQNRVKWTKEILNWPDERVNLEFRGFNPDDIAVEEHVPEQVKKYRRWIEKRQETKRKTKEKKNKKAKKLALQAEKRALEAEEQVLQHKGSYKRASKNAQKSRKET